jgi:hypothetical protein
MPHCRSRSIAVARVMLRTNQDLQQTVDFLQRASYLKSFPKSILSNAAGQVFGFREEVASLA